MAGELNRGHRFASVAPGDAVQSTCGGDSRPVVGIVRTVTARQFSVKFPGEAVGSANPWFRKFRRSDGRSVGDRCQSWAVPAGVALGDGGQS